jgi:hypothetical protein
VAAAAPITGVAVGDWANRATWRIDFDDSATSDQRSAAQSVVDAFDVTAETAATRQISKSTVLARLTDTQLDNALGLMTNRQKERWRAPDHPKIDVDDPDLLAVLNAVGADPNIVLAPE